MTELVIVSKPRGRVVRWIGGGVYKDYLSSVSTGSQSVTPPINISGATATEWLMYSTNVVTLAQSFKTLSNWLYIKKVSIPLAKVGSPTGTLTVELSTAYNASGTVLGTLDVSTLGTSYTTINFEPSSPVAVNPSTTYWIRIKYNGGNSSNYVKVQESTDVYADGASKRQYSSGSWYDNSGDLIMTIYGVVKFSLSFDFIYTGGYSFQKRLAETRSLSNCAVYKVFVNGVDKGSGPLGQDTDIPQADNYTLEWLVYPTTTSQGTFSSSIQRKIYYYGASLSINDLQATEAYVQQIKFGSSGGLIRFDKDPYCELPGSANEVITFSGDVYVPFRYLELVTGTAEILLIAVE